MAVVEAPIVGEAPLGGCVTRRSAFLRLWLLGLACAVVMAAEPLPAGFITASRFPEFVVRAFTFGNAALLLAVLVGLGTVAAREVGLFSVFAPQVPVSERPRDHAFHWVQAAFLVGVGVALTQLIFDFVFWRSVPGEHVFILRQAAELSASNPVSRVLFQVLTEELMLRWGLMSGLLWVLALMTHAPVGKRVSTKLAWGAIIGVSIAYVVGHLPAIITVIGTDTDAGVLLARTVTISAIAGVAYGWLYWKHSLESAILAHVLAQAGVFAFEGLALL